MRLSRCCVAPGEKFLDLRNAPVGIGEPRRVVRTVELDHARTGYVVGNVVPQLYRDAWIVTRVKDEGRHRYRRQDRADIDPERRLEGCPRQPGTRAHPFEHPGQAG